MTSASIGKVRCAIYTRVSTEQGLDQDFNSLDAQHEAASAYIKSQAHAGWTLIRLRYDDGGLSGASLDRPALQGLLGDVREGKIDVIVVYKVDRLTRSLADFAKLVELFDQHSVSSKTASTLARWFIGARPMPANTSRSSIATPSMRSRPSSRSKSVHAGCE